MPLLSNNSLKNKMLQYRYYYMNKTRLGIYDYKLITNKLSVSKLVKYPEHNVLLTFLTTNT